MFGMIEEGDKIVDFGIGSTSEASGEEGEKKREQFIAVVTESGKVYARGNELHHSLKHGSRGGSDPNECFEIKLTVGNNNQ